MEIKLADNIQELHQILVVQKENYFGNLSEKSINDKGFVTVKHSFGIIEKMNSKAPQVIAKDNDIVVAYALVMLIEFKNLIPVLVPMFSILETIKFKGKNLSEFSFYVMGQICVKDNYKRKGIFKKLYLKHKEVYSGLYEYCITEVSSSNKPSMLAHHKIGFKTIHTFKDATDEWNILLWDWTENNISS
ncbi:GNAT family N-acetyltransferase [Polaribacter sp. SA4-12]|uniref:GNAT family N-acetyltransferase n=1 Tax=Polaribacter sp. SA4-12 TaxID=1312072 RepID=UPI000B3BEF3D|nr:GNAT family N-acetyltransferase [Polaribacter sp. SA4-12]ARV14292.1 GNAT family N-acetyltransferase [Polaribacter sp. SA4-12]